MKRPEVGEPHPVGVFREQPGVETLGESPDGSLHVDASVATIPAHQEFTARRAVVVVRPTSETGLRARDDDAAQIAR